MTRRRAVMVPRSNPSGRTVHATELRPGDTILHAKLGREHVIEGPFRSTRGIRFVDQRGESVLLRPSETVHLVAQENPSRRVSRARSGGLVRHASRTASRARYPRASASLRAKRDRCVRDIKRRRGSKPYNAWAVCTAAMERVAGRKMNFMKPKRNPASSRRNPAKGSGIPKVGIAWIVGNHSVGASDEKVVADIDKRTKAWPEAKRKQAAKYALEVHHKNQKLYNDVMRGRFNPSGRKRRR